MTNPGPYDDLLAAEVRAAGAEPHKIQMIRVLRERAGIGLKDAKDAVEDFGARHGIPTLVKSPNENFLTYGCFVLVLGFLASALAIWTFWR